jgi:hypothetical protein
MVSVLLSMTGVNLWILRIPYTQYLDIRVSWNRIILYGHDINKKKETEGKKRGMDGNGAYKRLNIRRSVGRLNPPKT